MSSPREGEHANEVDGDLRSGSAMKSTPLVTASAPAPTKLAIDTVFQVRAALIAPSQLAGCAPDSVPGQVGSSL